MTLLGHHGQRERTALRLAGRAEPHTRAVEKAVMHGAAVADANLAGLGWVRLFVQQSLQQIAASNRRAGIGVDQRTFVVIRHDPAVSVLQDGHCLLLERHAVVGVESYRSPAPDGTTLSAQAGCMRA